MEFVIIKTDSELWNSLWDELASHPINEGIEDPSIAMYSGHCWEYRGSFKHGNVLISDFLHRSHPNTHQLYRHAIRRETSNKLDIQKTMRL